MDLDQQEQYLTDWKEKEALAESMIPLIGKLYRERNVVTSIYGRPIINRSVISLLKTHRFVRQVEENELSVKNTYPILEALATLDLGPSRVDIGKMAMKFREDNRGLSVKNFVKEEVANALGNKYEPRTESQDVVLYGFGRIGRLLARLLIEKAGWRELAFIIIILISFWKKSISLKTFLLKVFIHTLQMRIQQT